MEKIEIKGEVVNFKYKAIDGTMFDEQGQCAVYEKTAKCVIKSRIKILKTIDAWDFCYGYEDNYVEVVSGSKENIMMYVALSLWITDERKEKAIKELESFDESEVYLIWKNRDNQIYTALSWSAYIEKMNKAIEPTTDK